jgi:hypothetical protein
MVEHLTLDPKFKGSNPAAAGAWSNEIGTSTNLDVVCDELVHDADGANVVGVNLGPNVIKRFISVINSQFFTKLERLCHEKLFQPSLMFAGKARSLPQSGPPDRVGSGLTWKHWTSLEKLARDKRSNIESKICELLRY